MDRGGERGREGKHLFGLFAGERHVVGYWKEIIATDPCFAQGATQGKPKQTSPDDMSGLNRFLPQHVVAASPRGSVAISSLLPSVFICALSSLTWRPSRLKSSLQEQRRATVSVATARRQARCVLCPLLSVTPACPAKLA